MPLKYKANGDEEKGSERLKSAMRILALGLALLLALALPLSGCAPSQTAGTAETPEAEAGGERAALFDPSAYRWDRQTSTLYQTAEGEETALLVDEEIGSVEKILPMEGGLGLLYFPVHGYVSVGFLRDGRLEKAELPAGYMVEDIGADADGGLGVRVMNAEHGCAILRVRPGTPEAETLYSFPYTEYAAFCLVGDNVFLADSAYVWRAPAAAEEERIALTGSWEGELRLLPVDGSLWLCSQDAAAREIRQDAPALETTPLKILGTDEGEWISSFFYGADAKFAQKRPTYHLEFVDRGEDDAFLTEIASGSGVYDLYCLTNSPGYLYDLDSLSFGLLAPLEELESVRQVKEKLFDNLREELSWEGSLRGLPISTNAYGLQYEIEDIMGNRAYKVEIEGPPRAFATWEELQQTYHQENILFSMLEQYMLGAEKPGFTFDCPEFVALLELAVEALQGGQNSMVSMRAPSQVAVLNMDGNVDYYLERYFFPLPTLDAEGRQVYTYRMLAVNPNGENLEAAMDLVDVLARELLSIGGVEGFERAKRSYASLCFQDPALLSVAVGEDEGNLERWLQLQEKLRPVRHGSFQTTFYLDFLPRLQDGALSAEQCAKELQARWEMYQKERGG